MAQNKATLVIAVLVMVILGGVSQLCFSSSSPGESWWMKFFYYFPALLYIIAAWEGYSNRKFYLIGIPAMIALEYLCLAFVYGITLNALWQALGISAAAVVVTIVLRPIKRTIENKQKTEAEERDASTHN